METSSANPPLLDETKAVPTALDPRNVVRTRLRQARLAAAPHGAELVPQFFAAMRHGLEILRRTLLPRFHRVPKALIVSETAALGDRRLVSVVQFGRQRFLIGCGPSTVTLLARLPDVGTSEPAPAEAHPEPSIPYGGGGH